jgi:hypothetical protein
MSTNFNASLDLGALLPSTTSMSGSASKTSQRVLSEEAQMRMITQALSADQGLAQLLSSQNLAGGFGSSSSTLQAQDFISKVIAELAAVTAPLQETQESGQSSKKKMSVICTELVRQGMLDSELYAAGEEHFHKIPENTKIGYWFWATHVVSLMKRYDTLCWMLLPIVESRYQMITTGRFKLIGAATIYIGQPLCWLLGSLIKYLPEGDKDVSAESHS